MFARIIIALLLAAIAYVALLPEEHHYQATFWEADFPKLPDNLSPWPDDKSLFEIVRARDDEGNYVVGTHGGAGATYQFPSLSEYVPTAMKEITGIYQNAIIEKQEQCRINPHTPMGYSIELRHDQGYAFYWFTVRDGKLYFVMVLASEKSVLDGSNARRFRNSIRLTETRKP
ncbi:MAG TPA: hypothetical protein PLN21_13570 [Gemmatales bacterium]|nr:hypothetical protein [Gemmatales bacterium]